MATTYVKSEANLPFGFGENYVTWTTLKSEVVLPTAFGAYVMQPCEPGGGGGEGTTVLLTKTNRGTN